MTPSVGQKLHADVEAVVANQHKPSRKLVFDVALGMLGEASPVLSRIASRIAKLTGQNPKSVLNRISKGLKSGRLDVDQMLLEYLEIQRPFLNKDDGRDVAIVIDGSAIEKSRAKVKNPAMEGIHWVKSSKKPGIVVGDGAKAEKLPNAKEGGGRRKGKPKLIVPGYPAFFVTAC